MGLKVELINAAFSRCRISGLTAIPEPSDLALALRRLENMVAAWEANNICTGYNFEDEPDLNSVHNVERKHWDAFETSLAMRILADFGKSPHPTLVKDARGAHAILLSSTSVTDQVPYPSRHPVGSGNTLKTNRFRRFYRSSVQVPNDCDRISLLVGDIDIFIEHFDEWLSEFEEASSFTIESEKPSSLTITSSSRADADVTYTVEAKAAGTFKVTIVLTSTLGRVTTRTRYFQISEA